MWTSAWMCPSEYIKVTNTPSADKNWICLEVGYWAKALPTFDHTHPTGEHHLEAVHTRLLQYMRMGRCIVVFTVKFQNGFRWWPGIPWNQFVTLLKIISTAYYMKPDSFLILHLIDLKSREDQLVKNVKKVFFLSFVLCESIFTLLPGLYWCFPCVHSAKKNAARFSVFH